MNTRYSRETPYVYVHEAALLNFLVSHGKCWRADARVYSRVNSDDRKSNKQTAEEVANSPRCKNIEKLLSCEQSSIWP